MSNWKIKCLSAVDMFMTVIAFILVNWWAPVFAGADGWLPAWLKWFQTFDNSLDAGWKLQGNYGNYLTDGVEPVGLKRYIYRVFWLYRNPAYGFSYWALGVPFDPKQWTVVRFTGSEATGDLDFYAEGPDGQFNEHYMRDGQHVKKGWKAWNMFNAASRTWNTVPWGPEWRVPFVFSVSKV